MWQIRRLFTRMLDRLAESTGYDGFADLGHQYFSWLIKTGQVCQSFKESQFIKTLKGSDSRIYQGGRRVQYGGNSIIPQREPSIKGGAGDFLCQFPF